MIMNRPLSWTHHSTALKLARSPAPRPIAYCAPPHCWLQANKKWLKVKEGGIMMRRQDCPPEAFLTLDSLRGKRNGECLRIICIS